MANIAIIGAEQDNPSSINLRKVLLAADPPHICTLIAESATTSLLTYDLIITTRVMNGVNANGNIVTAFNSGVPVICGMMQTDITSNTVGPTSAILSGKIGLSPKSAANSAYIDVVSTTDDFLPRYAIGTAVRTHPANEFQSYTPISSLAAGAKVYFSSRTGADFASVAIAPFGSASLLGGTFPAACAIVGFLYASNYDYTPQAAELIRTLVDTVFLANNRKAISGYSLKEDGSPEPATVYAYKHSTGELFKKTETDVSGRYSITVGDELFFIVCDNGDPSSNLKIIGRAQGF